MKQRWWLVLIVTLGWVVPAQAASPEACPAPTEDRDSNRKEAKALFEQALMMEPSAPVEALAMLRCAETLAPRAAIALRIGTIEERLGHFAEAADAFERYLERAGAHAPDVEPMGERIGKLRARVKAQAEQEEQDRAAEREGSSSSGTQSVVGWVAGGTGLAFAIVGVALLGAAKGHSDSVHDIEPGTTAWSSDEASGTFEQAEVEQSVGIVGLAVGGSLLALGAVLLITDEGDGDSAGDVALSLGTDGRGAGGLLRVRF
jgi:hypothetical protein